MVESAGAMYESTPKSEMLPFFTPKSQQKKAMPTGPIPNAIMAFQGRGARSVFGSNKAWATPESTAVIMQYQTTALDGMCFSLPFNTE